jgi:hypothetical protein
MTVELHISVFDSAAVQSKPVSQMGCNAKSGPRGCPKRS